MKLHYYFLLLILGVSPMVSSAQTDSTDIKTYDFGGMDIEEYRKIYITTSISALYVIDTLSSYPWWSGAATVGYLHTPDFPISATFSVSANHLYFAPFLLGVETHKYFGYLVGATERRKGDLSASTQIGYRASFKGTSGIMWNANVSMRYWINPKLQLRIQTGLGNNGKTLEQTLVSFGITGSYLINH